MADIRLNVESKGLSFEQKKNGECKITGIGACTECDIIIGEKQKRLLGALTVSEIGIGAFAKMTRIESVVIPASVKRIGDGTFVGCTGLSCVHIPESIEKIADTAFFNTEVRDVYYAGSEKEWKRIETPAVKHFFECAQIYFEKDE